jgi:hypothetical protein
LWFVVSDSRVTRGLGMHAGVSELVQDEGEYREDDDCPNRAPV